MNSLQNPNFFFDHHQQFDQDHSSSSIMDFLNFSGYPLPDFGLEAETTTFSLSEAETGDGSGSMKATSIDNNTIDDGWFEGKGVKRKKPRENGRTNRVAFITKSELEILDDGFKWRKYGKKSVKNSPHPRNYYKCSSGECGVKKRVERDRDDSSYVITTYEGVHNHESPFLMYCNGSKLFHPHPICPNSSSPPYSSTTTL
ncbi:probable WRKY transcription factor 51 [Cucumis sativus]|uniref:WRKY domain-containing protein n=1 Tax=Cucumis sativus TaxID=3659 RepID=A0A0A0KFX2_CUCSA|nr:probable WRKY transcription factor 51 [Cucumis sativus]KGN48423.1 hypothetical protein Csa_004416 [Cucumis sativus]